MLTGSILAGSGCRQVSPRQLHWRMEEVLVQALQSDDAQLRCHGLESLAELGGPQAATLIQKELSDPTPAVRFAAAVAAGDTQDHTQRELLENLLYDENDSVKLAAAYALEKLGDQRFKNWYDSALIGDNPQLAAHSCILLSKLGNTALRSDSKENLWRVLNKPSQLPAVKLQAAEALAHLQDEKILRNLLAYAASGYADDRLIAISGLEKLAAEDAYSMLVVLVDDPQLEVQLAAVRALGTRAKEEDIDLARRAIRYLDEIGDPVATARVRGLAALALGRAGNDQDTTLLYQALADQSMYVRVAAARATIDFLRRRYQL